MQRRDLIAMLGAVTVWPFAGRAQQPTMPVVGFLSGGSPGSFAHLVDAFRNGLKETGFVEGQNIAIEYRYADGRYERLPQLAADLLNRQVAVIMTNGTAATFAAKAATGTIPIIFSVGDDPIKLGLAASLNRPGGNATGVSQLTTVLGAKRLELLHELVPKVAIIGVIANPNNPSTNSELRDLQDAARTLGLQLRVHSVRTDDDFDTAFTTLIQQGCGALLTAADQVFTNRRDRLVALAARHAIPTIYHLREFVTAGGLISYGISLSDGFHQVGVYAGRILKGEKSADLPVRQSTKFELVINHKTAKPLGLTIPQSILLRADEMIE